MASHLYIPEEPVTLRKRIRAHAVEISVAGASLNIGAVILATAHRFDEINPTSSLAVIPLFLVYGIGGFLTLGGVTSLYGLLVRKDNFRREMNVEQTGWLLIGLGWTAYLVCVMILVTGTLVGVILGVWVALGAFGRLDALTYVERESVKAVEEHEGDGAQDGA